MISAAILFFLLGVSAQDKVPLPTGVYTVDNLVDDFRAQLRTKLDEVSKNFYSKISGPTIQYYNDDTTPCALTYLTPKNKPVVQINVSETKSDSDLTQVVTYYSCDQKPLVRESFHSIGKNLVAMPKKDLWTGAKATFQLGAEETEKTYSFIDSSNLEIFRVRSYKVDTGVKTDFWILGKNVLRYEEYQSAEEGRVTINVNSFALEYNIRGQRGHDNVTLPANTSYRAVLQKSGQLFYYASGPGPTPLIKFSASFSDFVLGGASLVYRDGLKAELIDALPATTYVSSGIKASKLLDELRLNLSRLQSSIELQEVQNFVLQLIDLVQTGLVEDKRPITQ